jgi:putative ABC transport system permease protein
MLGLAILRLAFAALLRNRVRSALTMLGILIGVAAVICTVGLGQAASIQIQEQLAELGDNWVWIEAGNRSLGGARAGAGSSRLTVDDLHAILAEVPVVTGCSPQVDSRVQIIRGNQNWNAMYRGVSPEYLDIRRWPVVAGVPFTEVDIATNATVCVLGQIVVDQLFGDDDPIGQMIRIRDVPFKVIGVLKTKGQSGTMNQDDTLLMPYTTAQRRISGNRWFQDIMCSASSPALLETARLQIGELLRRQHRLQPEAPDDFTILRPEETLQLREQTAQTMTMMLGGIAAVSLAVGGVGILNIMLVSVTERTREIGLRMAIGARGRDVRLQFLVEALVLTVTGGLLGVATGLVASHMLVSAGYPVVVSRDSIVTAVGVATVVGVVFGYYPASVAARLGPIEALRAE